MDKVAVCFEFAKETIINLNKQCQKNTKKTIWKYESINFSSTHSSSKSTSTSCTELTKGLAGSCVRNQRKR